MDILGAELLAVGSWNDQTFTPADLAMLAAAARWPGRRIPVTAGHGGEPVGRAENIRVEDGRLVCDLVEIPEPVVRRMEQGEYRKVSVEIAWDRETCCEAVTAVALLTKEERPAVRGLRPIPLPAEDDVAVGGTD